jgi:hypothetical protein
MRQSIKLTCTGCGEYVGSKVGDYVSQLELDLNLAMSALSQIEQAWVDEADPDTGVSIQVSMSAEEMEVIARAALAQINLSK